MQRLNASIAADISPAAYDVDATGIGIVHIGPGAEGRQTDLVALVVELADEEFHRFLNVVPGVGVVGM